MMPRPLAFLACLLLTIPAFAAPRIGTLIARGEALLRVSNPACAEPLDAALFAAENDGDTYARVAGLLGLCRELQGRFADAHRLVSRSLEAAPPDTAPAGKAPRWAILRAALRRLDDRVARVLVTWPNGAELYVDGHPVLGVSGRVMAIDPGRRLFEARRGDKTIAAQEVEARAGDLPAVELTAKSTATPSRTTLPPIPRPTLSPFVPTLSPKGATTVVTYAATGLAVVAGVVAGILEAQRVSLASGLPSDACPTPDTSPRCAQLRQVFEQRTGARNVALVAAGFAVLAGGVTVGLHFAPGKVAPASGGLMLGARW